MKIRSIRKIIFNSPDFTKDGTDWKSLQEQKFVGDYYRFEDKAQILAMVNHDERDLVLSTKDYL